eukprot:TRINITY_DN19538_c0_g1_i1.p1 TRINITY_DN19538_c0_g1~~TRINITY_DN19538_c0_g1_i1.p1  ORF type:complete len:334 (+),score=32.12 TRINITY_DN19538_c0_g1_i1:96-1004(+)
MSDKNIFELGAKMHFKSQKSSSRAAKFALRVGLATGFWFLVYNRKTNLEGGMNLRTQKHFVAGIDRLTDWYCHMLGSNVGYRIGYNYQCELPFGKEPPTEEILNEFARGFMSSIFRYPETRRRALDEPLDAFTKEQLEKCNFLPPSNYDFDKEEAPENEQQESTSSWWPFSRSSKESKQPEQEPFEGDVIGGYFVHRRCGTENASARRRVGGTTATELGARSLVLAPDPWEGRAYILSATSGRGYCTLRMHYVVAQNSIFLPGEMDILGRLYESYIRASLRTVCTSAGNAVEKRFLKGAKTA